jgi:DNA-binding CsgD family transcriptional regulator
VQEAGNDKTLTAKELDALQCLANDMTLDAAARHLGVSTAAVKARLSAARQRLGAETNYHAVAVALRSKLIR